MHDKRYIRILLLVSTWALLLLGFFVFVRPWYLQWGATEQETRQALPGDQIILGATDQQTRAITIHAGVAQVWPWLAQIGQDRGGFYSFDLLENLVGCDMTTTDRLRPGRQSWEIGDKLWMYPPNRAGGVGYATLRTYLPGHVLGFGTHALGTPMTAPEDGSWSFILEPVDDATTRLMIRGRTALGPSLLTRVLDRAIFDPAHFVMERRMMIGIKQLSEGEDRGRLSNHVHVALFIGAFGLWAAAAILVLCRRQWQRPLAGFAAAGVVFQIVTLSQPPLLLGLTLLVAVGSLLWWPTPRESLHAAETPRPVSRATP